MDNPPLPDIFSSAAQPQPNQSSLHHQQSSNELPGAAQHVPRLLTAQAKSQHACPPGISELFAIWSANSEPALHSLLALPHDILKTIAAALGVTSDTQLQHEHTALRVLVKILDLRGGVHADDVYASLHNMQPPPSALPTADLLDIVSEALTGWLDTTPQHEAGGKYVPLQSLGTRDQAGLATLLGLPSSKASYFLPRMLARLQKTVNAEIEAAVASAAANGSLFASAASGAVIRRRSVVDQTLHNKQARTSASAAHPTTTYHAGSQGQPPPAAAAAGSANFDTEGPTSQASPAQQIIISNGKLSLVGAPSASGIVPLIRLASMAESPSLKPVKDSFLMAVQQLLIPGASTSSPGESTYISMPYAQRPSPGGASRAPVTFDPETAGWMLKAATDVGVHEPAEAYLRSILESTPEAPNSQGGRMLRLGPLLGKVMDRSVESSPPVGCLLLHDLGTVESFFKPMILLAKVPLSGGRQYLLHSHAACGPFSADTVYDGALLSFMWAAQSARNFSKSVADIVLRLCVLVCLSLWSFSDSLSDLEASGHARPGEAAALDNPYIGRAWAQWLEHLVYHGQLLFRVNVARLQVVWSSRPAAGPAAPMQVLPSSGAQQVHSSPLSQLAARQDMCAYCMSQSRGSGAHALGACFRLATFLFGEGSNTAAVESGARAALELQAELWRNQGRVDTPITPDDVVRLVSNAAMTWTRRRQSLANPPARERFGSRPPAASSVAPTFPSTTASAPT